MVLGGCAGPMANSGVEAIVPDAAIISGPVASIDAKPVKDVGKPVQVPPGNHVVRTTTKVVHSTNTATFWYEVPAAEFVLSTRAGFEYYVERQILDPSSESSPMRLLAYERDSSGRVLRTFAPTQTAASLRATRLSTPH
jgi:hypothetical protein